MPLPSPLHAHSLIQSTFIFHHLPFATAHAHTAALYADNHRLRMQYRLHLVLEVRGQWASFLYLSFYFAYLRITLQYLSSVYHLGHL